MPPLNCIKHHCHTITSHLLVFRQVSTPLAQVSADACAAEQGKASSSHLEVFTTRPDTLFGATYMVVAPEHALLQQLTTDGQQQQVQAYVAAAGAKSDLERTELQKVKTGVFTGARPSSCRHMCKVVRSMAWHAPCLARSRDVNLCFG